MVKSRIQCFHLAKVLATAYSIMFWFWVTYSVTVSSLFFAFPLLQALGYSGYFIFIFVAVTNKLEDDKKKYVL